MVFQQAPEDREHHEPAVAVLLSLRILVARRISGVDDLVRLDQPGPATVTRPPALRAKGCGGEAGRNRSRGKTDSTGMRRRSDRRRGRWRRASSTQTTCRWRRQPARSERGPLERRARRSGSAMSARPAANLVGETTRARQDDQGVFPSGQVLDRFRSCHLPAAGQQHNSRLRSGDLVHQARQRARLVAPFAASGDRTSARELGINRGPALALAVTWRPPRGRRVQPLDHPRSRRRRERQSEQVKHPGVGPPGYDDCSLGGSHLDCHLECGEHKLRKRGVERTGRAGYRQDARGTTDANTGEPDWTVRGGAG